MAMKYFRQNTIGLVVISYISGLLLAGCMVASTAGNEKEADNLNLSLYQAAQDFSKRSDHANAVNYYRKLYQRDAKVVKVVVGLASSLRHLQQTPEAQAIILRALKDAPKDIDLRAELGKVQLALGEPLKSIQSLSLVDAEIDGARWDIKVALAVAYDRIAMYDQAERRYRQALELSPENPAIMNNFSLSLAQAGKLSEALKILERAAALPEATPRMRQNLAMLYALKGNLPMAEKYVRRDMPTKIADQNMAYYRNLWTKLKTDTVK